MRLSNIQRYNRYFCIFELDALPLDVMVRATVMVVLCPTEVCQAAPGPLVP